MNMKNWKFSIDIYQASRPSMRTVYADRLSGLSILLFDRADRAPFPGILHTLDGALLFADAVRLCR